MMGESLDILLWNCNSIKGKICELDFLCNSQNLDIIALAETKIDNTYNLKLNGYTVYRQDRTSRGGGVALVVKNTIKIAQCPPLNLSSIETVSIKLTLSTKRTVQIICAYKPPDIRLVWEDLVKLKKLGDFLLLGDLNCKHAAWNCLTRNSDGVLLNNFCIKYCLHIVNPEEPTFYPTRPGHKESVIDIGLTRDCQLVQSVRALPKLSSNHNPVLFSLSGTPEFSFSKKYDFSKAEWPAYQSFLNDKLQQVPNIRVKEDIESAIKIFTDSITQALDVSVPIMANTYKKEQCSIAVSYLVKIKNHFRRKFQRTRKKFYLNIYNVMSKIVSKTLYAAQNLKWENKLRNIKCSDRLWSVKKLVSTRNQITVPPLTKDPASNNYAYTGEEKAELLGKYFESVHTLTSNLGSSTFTKKVENKVENFLKSRSPLIEDSDLCTSLELQNIICKLKERKAPGIDAIPTKALKNLSYIGIDYLVTIINSILKLSYFPDSWKSAKIVPIHKPGKPTYIVSSYRPISLLSTISKVVEKVISIRLDEFVVQNNILPPEQFGFRSYHSTTAQVARVVDDIVDGFNMRKHSGMLLLDVEKAFDCVWIRGLLYKLIQLNVPPYLIHVLGSYLSGRSFKVFVNNVYSSSKNIAAGVPQGSQLGPKLYIIYTHDVPRLEHIQCGMFADDTAHYTSSWRIDTIIRRLQLVANKLNRYYDKWKTKLNVNKTEVILFTRRRPEIPLKIKVFDQEFEWAKSVRYLGVHLDKGLTFTPHVNKIREKFFVSLKTIYPIFNRKSKLNKNNKNLLYKSCLRPVLTYACPVWSNTCETNLKKLQILQNIGLRIVGNYPRYTKINDIHKNLKFEYLKTHIDKLNKKFFEGDLQVNNRLLNHLITCDTRRYKKYSYKRVKHRYNLMLARQQYP